MSKPVIVTVDDDPVLYGRDLMLIDELGSLSLFEGLTRDQLGELAAGNCGCGLVRGAGAQDVGALSVKLK